MWRDVSVELEMGLVRLDRLEVVVVGMSGLMGWRQ